MQKTALDSRSDKLAGDIHHERALLARDSGYELAEKEFAKAVARLQEAVSPDAATPKSTKGLAGNVDLPGRPEWSTRGTPLGTLSRNAAAVGGAPYKSRLSNIVDMKMQGCWCCGNLIERHVFRF